MLEAGENPGWVARQMGHILVNALAPLCALVVTGCPFNGSRVQQWWGSVLDHGDKPIQPAERPGTDCRKRY
jgi:hypothetical protein